MPHAITRLLLILILFSGCYTANKTVTTKNASTDSGYVSVNDAKIFYQVTGNGEPVLCVHAGFMDHTMWDGQVAAFTNAGFKVITIDLPGHAKSTNADSTLRVPDYINAVLQKLDINKVSLVGLSLGGTTVTDYALEYPERVKKLILVSSGVTGIETVVTVDDMIKNYGSELRTALDKYGADSAAEVFTRYWADGMRSKEQTDPAVRNYVYTTSALSIKQHGWKHWARFQEMSAIEYLGTLKMPVLIIYGDKDLKLMADAAVILDEKIQSSRKIEIKNVAHMLNMEAPDEFNRIAIDFLKEK